MGFIFIKFKRFGLLVLLALAISSSANALNIQHFRPNFDGSGMLTLEGSSPLETGKISTGFYLNFDKNPFEFGAGSGNNRVDDIVNWHTGADIVAAYGITSRLSVGLGIQSSLFTNVEDIGSTVDRHTASFGDLIVKSKFSIINTDLLGLAVMPFLTIPTGENKDYLGDHSVTGGICLIGEVNFLGNKFISHVGYNIRSREQIIGLDVDDEILFGLGYMRPISKLLDLHILAEFMGRTVARHFLTRENTSPSELNIAARKFFFKQKLAVTAGVGMGLDNGYGSPDYRFLTGVSYN